MVYWNAPPMRRQEVVWLGKGTRMEAQAAVKRKGMRLIPLPLADKLIMAKDERIKGACWVNEFLAYPEPNGVFPFGKQIKDPFLGYALPWHEITTHLAAPELDELKQPGKALLISPEDISEEHLLKVESLRLIRSFLQESGLGKLDENGSGLPLEAPLGMFSALPSNISNALKAALDPFPHTARRLGRDNILRLVPLVHDVDDYYDGRCRVFADIRRDAAFGVVGVYDVDENGNRIEESKPATQEITGPASEQGKSFFKQAGDFMSGLFA